MARWSTSRFQSSWSWPGIPLGPSAGAASRRGWGSRGGPPSRAEDKAVSRISLWDRVRDVGGPRQPPVENQWHAYWDRLEEHVIFRVEAADYLSRLEAALGPQRGARVLDFGCGFGFLAELLRPRSQHCSSSTPRITCGGRRSSGWPATPTSDSSGRLELHRGRRGSGST